MTKEVISLFVPVVIKLPLSQFSLVLSLIQKPESKIVEPAHGDSYYLNFSVRGLSGVKRDLGPSMLPPTLGFVPNCVVSCHLLPILIKFRQCQGVNFFYKLSFLFFSIFRLLWLPLLAINPMPPTFFDRILTLVLF